MAAYTTINNPELYFQVKLYTGTGSSNAITLDGDEDMQPDLVYIQRRDDEGPPMFFDSVRGATKRLQTNNTDAEATGSQQLTAFGSDGFTVGTHEDANNSSSTYVARCWKAGTSFSNDASATSVGSIDSDGSINTTSGVAIIRWSGTGANATIAHGIAAPKVMLIKRISGGTESWVVYHQEISPAKHLFINNTDAENADTNNFQNTATTSSVFSVGTYNQMNASGTNNMIAYCFAEKQGFSRFGSYTGNGNADGTFIYTGFRPAMVLIKRPDATDHWLIYDDQRGYNGDIASLRPNESHSESTASGYEIDILSNGFKARQNHDDINGSGNTYVYMSFAKAPLVNSNGVPCNAR